MNSLDENTVTVHIEDTFQSSKEIQTATPSHTRTAGLPFDMPAKLQHLAQWWLAKVSDEVLVETAAVVHIVQSMPLDEVRALGQSKSSSSEERRANVGRRRRRP